MRRRSPNSDDYVQFVVDQLGSLDNLSARRMFDGHGLYSGPTFFGIVCRGHLYFKTDEQTRQRYVEHGMKPFRPNRKQTIKSYFQVPAAVIEDREQLTRWAREALQCQERTKR